MSQAGRGLNGGIDYVFNFLLILDYISNGNASFYVNSYGDLICHSIQIATSLTVSTLTVLGNLIAPTFQNTSNSFSVDSVGNIAANNIWCQKINNNSRLELNSLVGANAICYIEGKLGVNERNPLTGSNFHVVGDSTMQGSTNITNNLNVYGNLTLTATPAINVRTTLTNLQNTKADQSAVTSLQADISRIDNNIGSVGPVSPSLLLQIGSINFTLSQYGALITTCNNNIGSTSSFSPSLLSRTTTNANAIATNSAAITRIDSSIGSSAPVSPSLLSQIGSLNTTLSNLNQWKLKGCSYVRWTGSAYVVDYNFGTMSINFNLYGTGWHQVTCTSPEFNTPGFGFLQVQQVATSGTNCIFKITLQAVTTTAAIWEFETINLGGTRNNCGFQLLVF